MENPDRVTYFAATDARGQHTPFGIRQKDRSKHMYIIGKTGMGKSTMLENMAIQDIRNGEGIVFIDPHGATAEKLLEYIPEERIQDVVYFAPFDMERPIAFNVMEDVGYDKRHLVVSGLMATFKKIWKDAWSARMEYILSNTLLALLEYPGATLLGVNRMYTDKAYRKLVVDNIKDPMVKDFWTKEFAGYTDRYTQEATPAIQNKIGQFTSNPLIRNIIGQPKSSFNTRQMMDERKIIIINLSKGLVGDTNMQLLGSMLTMHIFLAAMSRAGVPELQMQKLPNFYFYVDEFQNFANETFAEILSESRKYKLNLVITHQYIEQMEEEVRAAVFGNVGTTIAFRVGPFDAEVLETIFMPEFTKEDLVNLGFAQIYLSLMIDGVGSRPFSATTIAPIEPPPQNFKDAVIAASRARFGNPREEVEAAITAELADTARGDNTSHKQSDAQNGRNLSRAPREESADVRAPRAAHEDSDDPRARRAPLRAPRAANAARVPLAARDEVRGEAMPRREEYSRAPSREHPQSDSTQKTTEDLKSVLRTITQSVTTEKVHKETAKQHELKSTLSDVLQRAGHIAPAGVPSDAKQPRPERAERALGGASPAAAQERAPAPPPPPAPQEEPPPPFEVSEKILKDVFKGNA